MISLNISIGCLNMNNMRVIFGFFVFILSIPFAHAGWDYNPFTVESIIVEGPSDGSWFNIIVNPIPGNTGCAAPTFMVLDASTNKGKAILNTLLTAQSTGRPFHILTDGCNGDRPQLEGVWTKP